MKIVEFYCDYCGNQIARKLIYSTNLNGQEYHLHNNGCNQLWFAALKKSDCADCCITLYNDDDGVCSDCFDMRQGSS